MTKEEWSEIKNKTIEFSTLWEFYKERGGLIVDYSFFVEILQHCLEIEMIIGTTSGFKQITSQSIHKNVTEYYDTKFSI